MCARPAAGARSLRTFCSEPRAGRLRTTFTLPEAVIDDWTAVWSCPAVVRTMICSCDRRPLPTVSPLTLAMTFLVGRRARPLVLPPTVRRVLRARRNGPNIRSGSSTRPSPTRLAVHLRCPFSRVVLYSLPFAVQPSARPSPEWTSLLRLWSLGASQAERLARPCCRLVRGLSPSWCSASANAGEFGVVAWWAPTARRHARTFRVSITPLQALAYTAACDAVLLLPHRRILSDVRNPKLPGRGPSYGR